MVAVRAPPRPRQEGPAVADPQPAPATDSPPPPAERRRVPRRPCPSRPLLRYLVRPSLLPRWAYALDFTPGGVAFLAAEPVGRGSVLALRVEDGPPGSSVIRTGHVAHCSPVAGGWRVGCAVSPPFSPAELAALA
jgi:PilZ domain